MDLQKLLAEEPNKKDPTWVEAQAIVERGLRFPTPLINLIRTGWNGTIDPGDFIKMLGFTGLNPSCLLDAADMPTDGSTPRAEDIAHAIQTLGIRFSAVVLAANVTVRSVLKRQPGPGWKTLLETTAMQMEVGYKLGTRVADIGLEGGLVLGFADYAGLGLLSAVKPEEYKTWHRETKKYGALGRKRVIEIFDCEPYQVSALTLQQLGFGTEVAFGAALAVGKLQPRHIEIENTVLRWKAGYEWLHALSEGRNYPPEVAMRTFFPAIAPPRDKNQKNRLLEVLYTDVSKIRRDGSRWTWHLPKPGYERTQEAFGMQA